VCQKLALTALASGFGSALAVFGKIAAAISMATLLTILVVLRLLLASSGVVIFVALLPSFHMLLVGSASVWHDASPS
jgi:hypothetical protein